MNTTATVQKYIQKSGPNFSYNQRKTPIKRPPITNVRAIDLRLSAKKSPFELLLNPYFSSITKVE